MPAKTTKSTKAAAKTPARATRGRRTAAAEAPVATKVVKTTTRKPAAKTAPAKAATPKNAPVKAAAKKTATTKQAAAKTPTARAPKPVSTERRHAMMMTLPELANAVEHLANNPASVKPADRTELLLEVVRRMRERRGGRVK